MCGDELSSEAEAPGSEPAVLEKQQGAEPEGRRQGQRGQGHGHGGGGCRRVSPCATSWIIVMIRILAFFSERSRWRMGAEEGHDLV